MEPTDISSYNTPNEQSGQPESMMQPSLRSAKPLIVGILLVLTCILGLFTWVAIFAANPEILQSTIPQGSPITVEQLQSVYFCAVTGIICSIVALLGGVAALKRKAWTVAVIGSIAGVLTVGPLFLGSGISIVALIVVLLSRKEFH